MTVRECAFFFLLAIVCLQPVAAQTKSGAELSRSFPHTGSHLTGYTIQLPPGGTHVWTTTHCSGGGQGRISFTYSVKDGGAGHAHEGGSRPTGGETPAQITIPCDGRPHGRIVYTAPKVSGVVTERIFFNGVEAPTEAAVYAVRVTGLVHLPNSPYITPVNLTAFSSVLINAPPHDHPDNHWGKPLLVNNVLRLAKEFFEQRHKKIVVNDLSLPWGGVLDFKDSWAPPHQTHQDGRHVDIQKVGAMDQDDEAVFRPIAERIFGKGHVCVDGGTHWHLVIETVCSDAPLSEFGYSEADLLPAFRK